MWMDWGERRKGDAESVHGLEAVQRERTPFKNKSLGADRMGAQENPGNLHGHG
ncbi:hypothetical protein ACSS6W_010429 [Trichoderma asperelloides]